MLHIQCGKFKFTVVSLSVCLSIGHELEPAKQAEPTEIPSGLWTVGPKNLVLGKRWSWYSLAGRGTLGRVIFWGA